MLSWDISNEPVEQNDILAIKIAVQPISKTAEKQ